MKVADKVAIVTGAGGGIGGAIAHALAREGAHVVVADLDGAAAKATADRIDAEHPACAVAACADTSGTSAIRDLIALAEKVFGPVDMYFANAGITGAPGLDADEAAWDRSLDVNLRSHIRAARLLVPGWVERGDGYFVSTASAAGLLTQIGSATYSVTKHAAVGFAEWLSVTYGEQGVKVSCLCPQGVKTKLLFPEEDVVDELSAAAAKAVVSAGDVLEPAQVAADTLAAIEEERFLILPHPQVLDMYRHKGSDYDRWLRGMRRYQKSLLENV
ncbi:SDR family oxidoreductase [Prescottella sp. R16]|uniref:SDR family oxidoreductase n=1 Tax=Prescottella sp. R16 TaxID=3064529 RepID=UPI00272E5D6C|nr:SDR family NAD(P)-dependent oxidoreductase [Prescottella sp. R16]